MGEPCDLTALEARKLIGCKQLSPVELLDSCLNRIEKVNGTLNAIVAMDAERARDQAKRDEAEIVAGNELEILHGLPVAIKDLNPVQGMRSTWGSLVFEHHVPDADDSVVANVRAAGGNILCKTNTPEFGAGANTKNRVYGATGNPFAPEKTCAGSSGGSAVSVATGMVPIAAGSDYGGSLRTPAGFCGVVGYRPSPGLVPTVGRPVSLNPFSVNGPMARNVADAHLLLCAQLDDDRRDPFSSDDVFSIPPELSGIDLGTLRVAWSTDLGCAPVDENIRRIFEGRIKTFGSCFGDCFERDPDMTDVHDVFEVLRGVNFVGAHRERLEKHRDLLGPNVIDNTERGMQYSLPDVARAHNAQSKIYDAFVDFFSEVDVLICPAVSVSPFPHAQLYVEEINGEKMPTYMRWLALTYAPTMALACACALPCGVDHLGMPFGIQVVGPKGSDALVLEASHSLETVLATHADTQRPIPDIRTLNT